jgi:hypothetical protein
MASDVVIRNSRIAQRGEGFGVSLRHTRNVTVENCEIFSPDAGAMRLMVGIKDIFADSVGTQLLKNNIYHTSTGIQVYQGLIEGNYVHDLGYNGKDHLNGLTDNGGVTTPLMIRHNTIFNQHDQTDAVSLFQDFGIQANRTVEDNLLAGGGYTIYAGGGKLASTNIRVMGNRFSRKFFPKGGGYGPVAVFDESGAGNVFSGNVWDDTNQPVASS